MRREILKATDISKRIQTLIEEEVNAIAKSPDIMSENFDDFVKGVFPFDEPTLDRLFDTASDMFGGVLMSEAKELYDSKEAAFGEDFMRRLERDVYLQVLDDLWMQHLENMDHLREGIHWMGVGQQDPLVEYRRQGQILFNSMQETIRDMVVRIIFNTYPVDVGQMDKPVETNLTRAARSSIENAGDILSNQEEFHEDDFATASVSSENGTTPVSKPNAGTKHVTSSDARKKARKNERKRKTVAKRRKH
jgi:preprotein translocase subunit SecA